MRDKFIIERDRQRKEIANAFGLYQDSYYWEIEGNSYEEEVAMRDAFIKDLLGILKRYLKGQNERIHYPHR